MARYAAFFLYPVGYATIERHVARDRAWRLFYRNTDVAVYTLAAAPGH